MGRSILLPGASNDDTPEVMTMKTELAALRAFKATTPPAADTELYLSKSLTSAHM